MSSGPDSAGDLIPQDMLEVFAHDRQGKRSKRSRRRGSFSRAFTWFKSRRRKTHRSNTDPKIDLLKPGPVPLLSPIKDHKEETENPLPVQHILENVFIEGNRPTFVQDLYSEAQEGLKLLQQDENRNGVDFQDDQSVTSTVTTRTDDDVSFSELAMSESESTADTISTRSSISYQSSRSGLTRQGSTFRPLKEDRRNSKRKAKKRHMGNVPGIPRHVQKELGLDRAAWTASQFTQAQLSNGGLSISTVVPTLDSISIASDGELMHLHTMNKETTDASSAEGHRDDLNLLQHFLSQSLDPQRPGSLAVPWMTTAGHCPPSPVMYVSPEATYKSKIIRDAILIPSVDVVELKRNRTRSSVRMVSQSSLASASPAPSRPSSRASSRISSRASSRFSSRAPSRASNQTGPNSEYSGWSNSGSSETLVSDSSTISNSSTPRVASRASQKPITDGPVRGNVRDPHVYGKTAQFNGDNKEEETWKKPGTIGQFRRNLSVTKKSKNPPPPPSRSYSLHAQRSKSNAKPKTEKTIVNPTHLAETCSSGNKSDTTDDGSVKLVSPYSQNNNVGFKSNIVKSHSDERQSWIKLKDSLPYFKKLAANGVVPSQTVLTLLTILDVPDPPHVLAPPPPPPEVWAHNQHTFELLCGPGPVNLMQWAHKRGMKIDCTPQVIVSGSTTMQSPQINGEVASFDAETSKNKLNPNILECNKKLVIQRDQDPPLRIAMDVQLTNGNTLPDSGPLHLSATPSPPAKHPLPKILTETIATQKAQLRSPLNEFLFLPPHPLYPPPPPPQQSHLTCFSSGLDETDTSFSENRIPTPPQVIPPPPPMVPPSPPALVILPNTSQIHQKTYPAPHVVPLPLQTTPPQPPPPQLIPPPPQIVPPPPQTTTLPQCEIPICQLLTPPSPQRIIPPPPHSIPPPQYEIPPPPQLIPPPPQFTSSAPEVTPIPPTDATQEIASSSCINFDIQLIPQMIPPPPNVLHLVSANLPSTHDAPPLEKESPPSTKEHKPTLIENPPPQKKASTTAEEVSFATQEVSSAPAGISQQFNVPPPPPPLPTDIKKEVKALLTEKQDKKQTAETAHSATTKEESPPPMVTQSLLQTVRLRSVKSKVETSPDGLPKPKASTQDPPQKPVRRSLILVATDLASQCAGDLVANGQLPTNLDSTAMSDIQPVAEPKKESSGTLQEQPNLHLEPAALPETAQSISQITDADKKAQNATSDLLNQSGDAESITVVVNKADPTPKTTTQGSPNTPKKSVLVPQTVVSKLPLKQNVSTASAPTSSMRLQEAIRLKTAAMSSNDQTKRLSLHSPPPSAGGISPTSTANFIFSKSPKKVVIETPLSTETNLQKTLMSELSSLPYKSKPIERKNLKVPPPVAKKPSAKNETADAEDVQTAGQ